MIEQVEILRWEENHHIRRQADAETAVSLQKTLQEVKHALALSFEELTEHDDTRAWLEQAEILSAVPVWMNELSYEDKKRIFMVDELNKVARQVKASGGFEGPMLSQDGSRSIGFVRAEQIKNDPTSPVRIFVRIGDFSIKYKDHEGKVRSTDRQKPYATIRMLRLDGVDPLDTPISRGGMEVVLEETGNLIVGPRLIPADITSTLTE